MKVSCPSEGKSKFTDAFIQTVCDFKGLLPELKNLQFLSKFPLGFNSGQKLIESLQSLEYIGSMEMFTKLSKADVHDLVAWVKEKNWNVVIGYKGAEYNVFNLDQSDPWKFKYIPDKGRVPVKRKLSIPTLFSDDEGDKSCSIDGRKRSGYLSPSVCSAKKSGSIISMKRSISSNGTPVNLDNEDFEFEFAMDSDGFIKNKDYGIPNYAMPGTMNDDDEYDDYDEFDEDTMDVEDLPEDAEFEWCWGEDGNLKIYEIDKNENDEPEDEVAVGQPLLADEQNFLEHHETEMSIDEPSNEIKPSNKEPIYELKSPKMNGTDNILPAQIENDWSQKPEHFIPNTEVPTSELNGDVEEKSIKANVKSKSKSESKTKSKSRSKKNKVREPTTDENVSSISSRKAKKRTAQLTPPPAYDTKQKNDTVKSLPGIPVNHTTNGSSISVIPSKAAKSDNEHNKAIKIASIFEKQLDAVKITQPAPKSVPKPVLADQPRKQNVQVPPSPKTHVIEVYEYDPLLGYCTVKRKTVPIEEVVENQSSLSVNMSFLNSNKDKSNEDTKTHENSIPVDSKQDNSKDQLVGNKEYLKEEDQSGRSSNGSSKENKLPNKQNQPKSSEKESLKPLVPQTSILHYDNHIVSAILEGTMGKSIPEPPRFKPPSLPEEVGHALKLPQIKRSVSLYEDEDMAPVVMEPTSTESTLESPKVQVTTDTTPPIADIKVEVIAEKETEVNVTVTRPEKPTASKAGCPEEAKEFYWDYEENCWKECDSDEEYEWEYIDSEEEKALEEVADKQKLSVCRPGTNIQEESIINISIEGVSDSNKDPSIQSTLQKDASKYDILLTFSSNQKILKCHIMFVILT